MKLVKVITLIGSGAFVLNLLGCSTAGNGLSLIPPGAWTAIWGPVCAAIPQMLGCPVG
ncbi:MAG: hypothetical protein JXQ73_30980 [Phycisphaerae bacterium]|nr:hypothetical protein [Phycisphaerae bacterium]